MSNDNFDQQIRDQFDEFEFDYRPEHWEALSKQLDARPERKTLLLLPFLSGKMGIAASVAALLSVLAAYWLWNGGRQQPVTAGNTQEIPATQVPVAVPQHNPQVTADATTAAATTTAALTTQTNTRKIQYPAASRLQYKYTGQDASSSRREAQPAADSLVEPTTAAIVPQAKEQAESTAGIPEKKIDNTHFIYPDVDFDLKKNIDNRSALGVTGGYNYGVANSGFALGVNAKQRLNRRLYLEGDLAYIQNNNPSATSNMSNVQYKAMEDGFKSPNMASAVTKIEVSNINKLSYLQFSPGLGYQLSSKFQLGLGADIQQMLQQDQDVIIYLRDKEDLRTVLSTDIGLVGKTQYKINEKLKAGILYREGVQAAFDHKYFNRRYVQFSFNYMLFQR